MRLGDADRVLDVDRREILVARDVEVDREVHHPVARVRRLVVEESIETGELLLDRRCDGVRHVLCARAGVDRDYLNCRGRDLGVAVHRQREHRDHAEEGDGDGDHHRQHWTPHEQVLLLF